MPPVPLLLAAVAMLMLFLATAILGRLLHYATTLNIKGQIYRLKEKRKAGLLGRRVKRGRSE